MLSYLSRVHAEGLSGVWLGKGQSSVSFQGMTYPNCPSPAWKAFSHLVSHPESQSEALPEDISQLPAHHDCPLLALSFCSLVLNPTCIRVPAWT